MTETLLPPPGDVTDNDKLMAALSYFFTPIVGIIVLLVDTMKVRPYQKYHAIQSIGLFVAEMIFYVLACVVYFACTALTAGILGLCLWAGGPRGMVVSQERLASEAGAQVLREGKEARRRTPQILAAMCLLLFAVSFSHFEPEPEGDYLGLLERGDCLGFGQPLDFLQDGSFDIVTAVSSIEHFGLGGYGRGVRDPLADRRAMEVLQSLLKPGGQLLLSVPYGVRGVTAKHRVYDASSLAALLDGFTVTRAAYFRRGDGWRQVDAGELADVASPSLPVSGVAVVDAERGRDGGGGA